MAETIQKFLKRIHIERFRKYLEDPPQPISLSTVDFFNIFILTTFAYITRIWRFQHPASIVFDEIHFGNFTNFYINRQYFFDIHPPLAKLIIAGFANLAEYDASIHFGSLFGKPYPHEGYIPIRFTPILFSSLVPACLYLSVRFASFSSTAAFAAAALFCFDTSAITEGRFILTDGILHFFVSLSLALTNYYLSLTPYTLKWDVWIYIASLGLGCAISVKYTAMSLCILIGFIEVVHLLIESNFIIDADLYANICFRALQAAGPAFALHIVLWMIHLGLLIFVGEDTSQADIESYHLINLNTTNSTDYSAPFSWPPLIGRVLSIIAGIQMSNAMNYQPHPYMSRPMDWPLLTDVWVGFWSENHMEVDCVGNLFVYYCAFIGVLLVIFGFKKCHWPKAMRFALGYIFSYLPFYGVPRTMFLYHYLIPLMFGCCCFGVALDLYLPKFYRGYICSIAIGLAVYGYLVWCPLVYAIPEAQNDARIWNKAWRYGRSGREKWVEFMQKRYEEVQRLSNSTTN